MTNASNPTVVPSEVGWQFVPQYYTFVNKQPHRLHCFYTKASTFVHGNEGEDGKPCYGQQEIHNKITSIGFKDCKVFIHSVDAQSSANGGIIIQVIGEMSNHGDPWRKFVQTFFLAEQPNGYFVLNDIFRFLKEDSPDSDEASETAEHEAISEPAPSTAATPASPAPTPAQNLVAPVETVEEPPVNPSPPPPSYTETSEPPAPAPAAPEPVQPSVTAPIPAAVTAAPPSTSHPNGAHTPAPIDEPEKNPAPPASVPEEPPASTPAPAAAAPVSTAAPTPPPAAAPVAPTGSASGASQKPTTHSPAPAPAPAAPKSWASLAATNSNKWGSAVAQESRGVTESPVTSAPASGTQTPPTRQQQQQHHHHHHQQQQQQQQSQQRDGNQQGQGQGYNSARDIQSAHCFVKGVTEPISQTLLNNYLTQRFGPIKDLDIIRSKACAFLEFSSLESARKAISASPLYIDAGVESGPLRISVETKKDRADRAPSGRTRGGTPVNGGPSGGDRAGTASSGPGGGGSGNAGGNTGGGGHGHSHGHGHGGQGGEGQGGRGGYRGRGAARGGRGTPAAK